MMIFINEILITNYKEKKLSFSDSKTPFSRRKLSKFTFKSTLPKLVIQSFWKRQEAFNLSGCKNVGHLFDNYDV